MRCKRCLAGPMACQIWMRTSSKQVRFFYLSLGNEVFNSDAIFSLELEALTDELTLTDTDTSYLDEVSAPKVPTKEPGAESVINHVSPLSTANPLHLSNPIPIISTGWPTCGRIWLAQTACYITPLLFPTKIANSQFSPFTLQTRIYLMMRITREKASAISNVQILRYIMS